MHSERNLVRREDSAPHSDGSWKPPPGSRSVSPGKAPSPWPGMRFPISYRSAHTLHPRPVLSCAQPTWNPFLPCKHLAGRPGHSLQTREGQGGTSRGRARVAHRRLAGCPGPRAELGRNTGPDGSHSLGLPAASSTHFAVQLRTVCLPECLPAPGLCLPHTPQGQGLSVFLF